MSSTSAPLSAPLAARAGWASRLAGSPTLRFIVRRLLAAIPVLFGVTFLSFVVMNSLPGDAAQELLGASATPAEIHQLEAKLGLNQPFLTRYWDWLHNAVIGHLGHSLSSGQSVGSILASDLPVTFELVAFAFVISLALAVPIALLSRAQAERRRRPAEHDVQHGRPVDRAVRAGARPGLRVRGQAERAAGDRVGPARDRASRRTSAT